MLTSLAQSSFRKRTATNAILFQTMSPFPGFQRLDSIPYPSLAGTAHQNSDAPTVM